MPRAPSSSPTLLLALLVLAAAAFFWLQKPPPAPQAGPPPVPAPAEAAAERQPPAAKAPSLVSAAGRSPDGGKTQQNAYQFALRGGQITLEGVEVLRGNFHRRRGPMPWRPGMWCVRFLDADMRVLAQETTAAPDEPCVVLDPHALNADGSPKASKLKLTDDVMLQMRVPPVPGASWIKIYRIAGTQPAALDAEPLGRLLASIPLPAR